jgi:hypothetical protein
MKVCSLAKYFDLKGLNYRIIEECNKMEQGSLLIDLEGIRGCPSEMVVDEEVLERKSR